jgi:hypothetical protein
MKIPITIIEQSVNSQDISSNRYEYSSKYIIPVKTDLKLDNQITFGKNNVNLKDKEMDNSIMGLNDNELNKLEYTEALKLDKRTYWQYYFSLLKIKHLLMLYFLMIQLCIKSTKMVENLIFFIKFHKYYILLLFQVF